VPTLYRAGPDGIARASQPYDGTVKIARHLFWEAMGLRRDGPVCL